MVFSFYFFLMLIKLNRKFIKIPYCKPNLRVRFWQKGYWFKMSTARLQKIQSHLFANQACTNRYYADWWFNIKHGSAIREGTIANYPDALIKNPWWSYQDQINLQKCFHVVLIKIFRKLNFWKLTAYPTLASLGSGSDNCCSSRVLFRSWSCRYWNQ